MPWLNDLFKYCCRKLSKKNKKKSKNQQDRIEKHSGGQVTESFNQNAVNSLASRSAFHNTKVKSVMVKPSVGCQDNAPDINSLYLQETMPLACYDMEHASRANYMPVEKIMHFALYGDYAHHLQGKKIFCDVTVRIETKEYAAHRMSLACMSGFFADIFYILRNEPHAFIRLNTIKPVAFEVLLQYIYTGVLPITSEVVGDLMKMAKILRIPMIKTVLNDYIESLPLAHALAILIKVKLFGSLYDKTMIAICEQFNTFRLEADFLDIDIETILIILNRDKLNISSELDVFKAAIMWVAHNIMHRKQHLIRLMKCVRFPFMTQVELFQCNELTSLLKENDKCIQMILEANWIVSAWMLQKEDPFNLMVPNPRIIMTVAPIQDR